jgi:hypothetical protein
MRRWTMWAMAATAAVLVAGGSAHGVEQTDRAAAADVKIAEDTNNGRGYFSGIDFAASDRFDRAWLVLHYNYQGPCVGAEGECVQDAPLQVNVPGLIYDAPGKRVVYQRPGAEPVVCAVGKGGGPELSATGRCTTRLVKVDRLVDNGFDGRRDRRDEIHLSVPAN